MRSKYLRQFVEELDLPMDPKLFILSAYATGDEIDSIETMESLWTFLEETGKKVKDDELEKSDLEHRARIYAREYPDEPIGPERREGIWHQYLARKYRPQEVSAFLETIGGEPPFMYEEEEEGYREMSEEEIEHHDYLTEERESGRADRYDGTIDFDVDTMLAEMKELNKEMDEIMKKYGIA